MLFMIPSRWELNLRASKLCFHHKSNETLNTIAIDFFFNFTSISFLNFLKVLPDNSSKEGRSSFIVVRDNNTRRGKVAVISYRTAARASKESTSLMNDYTLKVHVTLNLPTCIFSNMQCKCQNALELDNGMTNV